MSLTASELTPADIAAVTGGGNSNSGWGSGDGAWWLIILFLFAAMSGWGRGGFGGGEGTGGGTDMFPYYYLSNNTDNGVQRGFDTATITGQLSGIQNAITNGFSTAEISNCNRTIDQLQQSFANTQAIDSRLDSLAMALQQCCCDNRAATADLKYTIATENCQDRYEAAQNTRDIITNQTASTQAILDKLCQLELDGKNDRIADLERQLTMANLAASQTIQTARLESSNSATVDALYNRLATCPIGTMPVYGSQPIFTCNNGNNGCGCGGF